MMMGRKKSRKNEKKISNRVVGEEEGKISPGNEGKKEEEENNDSCSFLPCILTPHTQLLAPLRAHIIFFHQPFHPRHVEHMKCKMAEHKKNVSSHILCDFLSLKL